QPTNRRYRLQSVTPIHRRSLWQFGLYLRPNRTPGVPKPTSRTNLISKIRPSRIGGKAKRKMAAALTEFRAHFSWLIFAGPSYHFPMPDRQQKALFPD